MNREINNVCEMAQFKPKPRMAVIRRLHRFGQLVEKKFLPVDLYYQRVIEEFCFVLAEILHYRGKQGKKLKGNKMISTASFIMVYLRTVIDLEVGKSSITGKAFKRSLANVKANDQRIILLIKMLPVISMVALGLISPPNLSPLREALKKISYSAQARSGP